MKQKLKDFKKIIDDWGFYIPTDMYECMIDEYIKSFNYELSEPEADSCNKQAKEFCSFYDSECKERFDNGFTCESCINYG